MDKKLHLLDSFRARGSDGATYQVRGYEHLVRDEASPALDAWAPTGQVEYRLAEGDVLRVAADGTMTIPRSGVTLSPEPVAA